MIHKIRGSDNLLREEYYGLIPLEFFLGNSDTHD